MIRIARWMLGVMLCVVAHALGARALGAQSDKVALAGLGAYYHTAWTSRDGAPADVSAIAQSKDGMLWLGTSTGLYRFDGIQFERVQLPNGAVLPYSNVSALLAAPDGSMWIGYRFGGLSRLEDQHLTNYSTANGLPSATVYEITIDSTGVVWAATGAGLLRGSGGQWRSASGWGLPDAIAYSAKTDSRGALWVSTLTGVYTLRRRSTSFERTHGDLGVSVSGAFGEAPNGRIWGGGMSRGLVPLESRVREVAHDNGSPASGTTLRSDSLGGPQTVLIDREGSAWLGTVHGLLRVELNDETLHQPEPAWSLEMGRSEGLSGSVVIALLQDREGNVWVGTETGIDRFRHTKLTSLSFPTPPAGPSVAAGDSGALWVGTMNGATYVSGPSSNMRPLAAAPVYAECTYRDATGGIWIGDDAGNVWHSDHGVTTAVSLPADAGANSIQALAVDRAGRLWVSVVRKGLYRRDAGGWRKLEPRGITSRVPLTVAADSAGRVWLGYTDDQLALIQGDSVRVFGPGDGLRIGNVMTVHAGATHIWVGGDAGLARFDGTRFRQIHSADAEQLAGISGIVETRSGEVWINGSGGISRLPALELQKSMVDSTYAVIGERFDYRDGVDGTAPQIRPQPSAIQGTDGRLWFVTGSRVLWIVPEHIRRNSIPPAIAIRAADASGISYPILGRLTLPQRTAALHIQYSAASLTMPERVRFRYQLVGSDPTWQEAGARREAFYTNLRPGNYRFRVVAANEDGVWNNTGASLELTIPPTFTQTNAFLALCALAIAGLMWLFFTWRHRVATRALQSRFDATLAERTRIAQELHDTLLQGFAGVTAQLYAVQRQIASRSSAAATTLASALTTADASLRDARQAVWEMRSPTLDALPLPDALRLTASEATGDAPPEVRHELVGTPCPLARDVERAVLRTGREAVINALRHAEARTIRVVLEYTADSVVLLVEDDGRGFDSSQLDTARQHGHWGVVGIFERAARSGGIASVDSTPGRGTRVTITLPALPRTHR